MSSSVPPPPPPPREPSPSVATTFPPTSTLSSSIPPPQQQPPKVVIREPALKEALDVVLEMEDRKRTLENEIKEKTDRIWALSRQTAARKRLTIHEREEADEKEDDLGDVPPSQRLIVPGDVVDVSDENATTLEWIGTSGLKITLLAGLEKMKKLHTISFRSGFIRKPSGLSHLKDTLTILELYENRLRTLEGVEIFKLETLDVSYNRLGILESRFLAPLGPTLRKLYVAENKLTEMNPDALRPLVNLVVLDIGGNHIRNIQGLETMSKLEELWLGKNKITVIEGLHGLRSLKRLSIQSNRITKMEGLDQLVNLEELYLSDQGIAHIEGLDNLVKLNTLDLTNNKLTSTIGLPKLDMLTDLWLAANQLSRYEDVDRLKPQCPKLETLVMERNPIAGDYEYKMRLKATLPTLTTIDATPVLRSR